MQAVLCENVPNAPAMPLGTTESIYGPKLAHPTGGPVRKRSRRHAALLDIQRPRAYSMPQMRPRAYLHPPEHERGPTL